MGYALLWLSWVYHSHPHLAGLICRRSETKIHFFKSKGQVKFCLRLNQLPQLLQPGSFVTEILQKHQAPMESNHRFSHIETAMPSGIHLIHPPFSDSPASATAGRFVAEPSNGPPPKSARGDMTRSRSQEDAERTRWELGTPVDPARYPPEN